MKMPLKWLKQNWLWVAVNILAVGSLISLVSMFSIDFTSGTALPTISVNEMPAPPDRRPDFEEAAEADRPEEGAGREHSPFDFIVKSSGESAIRWLVLSLSATLKFYLSAQICVYLRPLPVFYAVFSTSLPPT